MPSTYTALFEKLGAIMKRISDIRDTQRTFAPLDLTTATGLNLIRAQYTSAQQTLIAAISDGDAVGDFGRMPIAKLIEAAQRTIIDFVDLTAGLPLAVRDVPHAFREMAAQLIVDGDSLDGNAVSGSSAARSGNAGNGAMIVTTLAPTYLARGVTLAAATDSQFIRTEKWRVTCTGDANTGFAAGNEQFRIDTGRGFDRMNRRWRAGSGTPAQFFACTSSYVEGSGQPGQNILVNSAFERTASNLPTEWVARTGTAGVDINTTATAWNGTGAMRLIGGGTANPAFGQLLGASTGSLIRLIPDATYAVAIMTRSNSGTINKTITAQFANAAGTSIGMTGADSVAVSSHTTSYSRTTGAIHTPPNLTPGAYYFDVRNTDTTLASGEEVYIDAVVAAPFVRVAAQSGGIVGVTGATQFRNSDHFDITWTNDDAGTLLYWLDCLYDCYHFGLRVPVNTAGAETIPDTLFA